MLANCCRMQVWLVVVMFRRSTHDSLTFMIDRNQRNMNAQQNAKRYTQTVYFDLSSAFDTVQHHLNTWKLEHQFFISGTFLKCMDIPFRNSVTRGRERVLCTSMHLLQTYFGLKYKVSANVFCVRPYYSAFAGADAGGRVLEQHFAQ